MKARSIGRVPKFGYLKPSTAYATAERLVPQLSNQWRTPSAISILMSNLISRSNRGALR